MTQRDLDRAVARATGETVDHVRHMGFTLTVVPAHARRHLEATGDVRPQVAVPNHDWPLAIKVPARA